MIKKAFISYLLFGVLALAISIVFSLTLFAPTHGFPMDLSKAPDEVKNILNREPKSEPLTTEELIKINRLMSQHDPDSNQRLLVKTIKYGWISFFTIPVIFAAICLVIPRANKKFLPLILLPSLLSLSPKSGH